MRNKITIRVSDENVITLIYKKLEETGEIDLDRLLKIDYNLLLAEIITFPAIVNKFGLLLSEMENKVNNAKLNLDAYEAKRRNQLRDELPKKGKKATVDSVEDALKSEKIWFAKKTAFNNAIMRRDFVNSIFWSCKDKSDKLSKLSLSVEKDQETLENMLVESGISEMNGVEIISRKTKF